MEKEKKKISIGALVLIILISIIITAIATIWGYTKLNKSTIQQGQVLSNEIQNAKLEEVLNEIENTTSNAEENVQNILENNIAEKNVAKNDEKVTNKTAEYSDLNDDSVTYHHIEAKGERELIKIKQTLTKEKEEVVYNDKVQISINNSAYKDIATLQTWSASPYVSKVETIKGEYSEGMEDSFIVVIIKTSTPSNYNYSIYVLDVHLNVVGKIGTYGATSYTIKNDGKDYYLIGNKSIITYDHNEKDEIVEHKYTVENHKIVDKVIEKYKENEETYGAGAK